MAQWPAPCRRGVTAWFMCVVWKKYVGTEAMPVWIVPVCFEGKKPWCAPLCRVLPAEDSTALTLRQSVRRQGMEALEHSEVHPGFLRLPQDANASFSHGLFWAELLEDTACLAHRCAEGAPGTCLLGDLLEFSGGVRSSRCSATVPSGSLMTAFATRTLIPHPLTQSLLPSFQPLCLEHLLCSGHCAQAGARW